MQKINKRNLIESVAEGAHLSTKDAKEAVDLVFNMIEKSLLEGVDVNISNFGVFEAKVRQERIGTDPKTHKRITLKETRTVVFHPAKLMKDRLN